MDTTQSPTPQTLLEIEVEQTQIIAHYLKDLVDIATKTTDRVLGQQQKTPEATSIENPAPDMGMLGNLRTERFRINASVLALREQLERLSEL